MYITVYSTPPPPCCRPPQTAPPPSRRTMLKVTIFRGCQYFIIYKYFNHRFRIFQVENSKVRDGFFFSFFFFLFAYYKLFLQYVCTVCIYKNSYICIHIYLYSIIFLASILSGGHLFLLFIPPFSERCM